jgi:DNA polymerase-3 subunit alpha
MNGRPFAHLHCHTHYSLLDGAGDIGKLVERCKEHGMSALAITDHGNLHGALEFYRKCKGAGINPIIGYEAYIAPKSRFDREYTGSSKEASYHLTLLAQNRNGFRNLVKLASFASLEGFYFKPRIDKELLTKYHEGIICLSGCVSSEFSRALLDGEGGEEQLKESIGVAEWFHKLFGDRYFLEIMNNGIEIQRRQLEGAVEIAKRMGLPLVATSDTHYVDEEDAEAQDVMLCINTGRLRSETNRMRMEGNQFFLRSPEQMYAQFQGLEEAVARSQEIADTVNIELELGKRHFPKYAIPAQFTSEQYLRQLCEKGLRERYAGNIGMIGEDGQLSNRVIERLDRELDVIERLGFSTYFLIVWDFVDYARQKGIWATARGSGVGALVCYGLYLSHVCPLEYDLLFERFLDENRIEPPDIDIDFDKDRRGEVIQYVKDKYGSENVCQIGTFGTLQARAAIKDVGRALNIPLQRVNQITEMVPDELKITIRKAMERNEDLANLYKSDAEIREVLDLSMRIEGLARNIGTHAAAVVIADQPLTEYLPLGKVPGKQDVITQWSMGDVEAAGLLKMDFLGLRNLTILSKAVELIEQSTGKSVDPLKFPLDDSTTYKLLQRGETKGVFQLESGGIRDLLQRMKPDNFRDIIATNALYRPGPLEGGMVDTYVNVKLGREKPVYKHSVLEEVLAETNSVMVYQEQVMRILNRLGEISLANAYSCIKAISKKKESIINANHDQFIKGATDKGLSVADAEEIWGLIQKFAGYGFNKSHSTAYALVAYQTAYLKAHYPIEFMAALLTSDISSRNFKRRDPLVEHVDDCKRMSIEVVPPSVNTSEAEFSVKDGKIHFALSAIKGCGGTAAEAIVNERRKRGPFMNIFDFCERVDPASCGKTALETLIKSGAMDCFQSFRSQMYAVIDKALLAGTSAAADRRSGQQSLFGDFEEETVAPVAVGLPNLPEWSERELAMGERETLYYHFRHDPFAEYEPKFKSLRTHMTRELVECKDRDEVIIAGRVGSIKIAHTKNPKPNTPNKYANFDLDDAEGTVRCIMWPRDFEKHGHALTPDAVLLMRGVVDRRGGGEEVNFITNEIITLDSVDEHYTRGVQIELAADENLTDRLPRLKEVLRGHPGDQELLFQLKMDDGAVVLLKSTKAVQVTSDLRQRLDDFLGAGKHRVLIHRPKLGNQNNKGPKQQH